MNIRCLLAVLHASEKLFNLMEFLSGISDLANCLEVQWSWCDGGIYSNE